MKLFLLFLIFPTLLQAKTWIELAQEADYHSDHPGRKIENPKDHPKRLEFLKLNTETLKTILTGEPAVMPDTQLSFEDHWSGNFLMAQAHLDQLIEAQTKLQKWDEADELLKLGGEIRKKVWAAEPDYINFMVARSSTQSAYNALEDLARAESPATRKLVFSRLKSHWIRNRPLRKDFLLTEKAELRFAREMANDIKGFLKSTSPNLDSPPLFLEKEFPHQLTAREILKLPFNKDQFREESLKEVRRGFAWIRSGEPITTYLKKSQKRPPRDLKFYQSNPNGLREFLNDCTLDQGIPTLIHHALIMTQLQETAWHWLSLEAGGTIVRDKDHLLKLLPATIRDFVETSEIEIDFFERSLTAPKEPLIVFSIEYTIAVPNLFPN